MSGVGLMRADGIGRPVLLRLHASLRFEVTIWCINRHSRGLALARIPPSWRPSGVGGIVPVQARIEVFPCETRRGRNHGCRRVSERSGQRAPVEVRLGRGGPIVVRCLPFVHGTQRRPVRERRAKAAKLFCNVVPKPCARVLMTSSSDEKRTGQSGHV
jgi:hypothetical protein